MAGRIIAIVVLTTLSFALGANQTVSKIKNGAVVRLMPVTAGQRGGANVRDMADYHLQPAKGSYLEINIRPGLLGPGQSFAHLSMTIATHVNTRIRVRAHDGNLALDTNNDRLMTLLTGEALSVSFIAYHAGHGTIDILNANGHVIRTVPYTVEHLRSVRQSVSGNITTDGTASLNYSVSDFQLGVSGSVSINYGTDNNITGSASISYSW